MKSEYTTIKVLKTTVLKLNIISSISEMKQYEVVDALAQKEHDKIIKKIADKKI